MCLFNCYTNSTQTLCLAWYIIHSMAGLSGAYFVFKSSASGSGAKIKGYVPGVSLMVFTNPESTDPIKHTKLYSFTLCFHACIASSNSLHQSSQHLTFSLPSLHVQKIFAHPPTLCQCWEVSTVSLHSPFQSQ